MIGLRFSFRLGSSFPLQELIANIEASVPASYNYAARQPTERSQDEIKAEMAVVDKKMKAAQVHPNPNPNPKRSPRQLRRDALWSPSMSPMDSEMQRCVTICNDT
jgi:hypothetical protein